MGSLASIGRIFYGVAIAALGFLTIYYHDLPYMLIPPNHLWLSDHIGLIYVFGGLLFLAGGCIAFNKWRQPVSLLLGVILLVIFCFYFLPYELFKSPNNKQFGDWENAAKELALAAGAFVVAGYRRLVSPGVILFCLTIISFSIDHFLYAREAAGYVPAWIPSHVFWLYLTGTALLGFSTAILLSIRPRLFATFLGIMIFIWVVILHIPYALSAPFAQNAGEVVSAFLALAYCGIAFAVAGSFKAG